MSFVWGKVKIERESERRLRLSSKLNKIVDQEESGLFRHCGLASLFQLTICFWFAALSYQAHFPFLLGTQLGEAMCLSSGHRNVAEVLCVISGQKQIYRYTFLIIAVLTYKLNRKNSDLHGEGRATKWKEPGCLNIDVGGCWAMLPTPDCATGTGNSVLR